MTMERPVGSLDLYAECDLTVTGVEQVENGRDCWNCSGTGKVQTLTQKTVDCSFCGGTGQNRKAARGETARKPEAPGNADG